MTLAEVLVSTLLLGVSSSAALGVWSGSAQALQRSGQQRQGAAQLELMRLASQRWIAAHAARLDLVSAGPEGCHLDAGAVAAATDQALPLAQGITRRWYEEETHLGLWQELTLLDDAGAVLIRRRQLFSPAAFGLCRP